MSLQSVKNTGLLLITWILLIQVVNLSIDPMDPIHNKSGKLVVCEDLTVNEIESIYELVSEHCMGVDVPEHDENDQGGFVKVMVFFFANNSIKIKEQLQNTGISFFVLDEFFHSADIDCISPPPKLG